MDVSEDSAASTITDCDYESNMIPETSVRLYQNGRRHIPEYSNVQSQSKRILSHFLLHSHINRFSLSS